MKQLALLTLIAISVFLYSFAQKQQLEHEDFKTWLDIRGEQIANDGNWVSYQLTPGDGDPTLKVYDVKKGEAHTFARGSSAKFTTDSRFLVFQIEPMQDSMKAMRRRKVDKEDLPNDTLGVLDLASGKLTQLADVNDFTVPEKWSDWVFYQIEPAVMPKDTSKAKRKQKRPSKKNGYHLVIHQLSTNKVDTIPFVKAYELAEESPQLMLHTSGMDSTFMAGVYRYDFEATELLPLHRSEGDYEQMAWDKAGNQAAFIAYTDTTDTRIKHYELYHWKAGLGSAKVMVNSTAKWLEEDWSVNEFTQPLFSENGAKLYFEVAPNPILQDTSLLDEEIVNVEVWHYQDPYLYTQKEVRLKQEKEKGYWVAMDVATATYTPLATEAIPEVALGNEGNAKYALGYQEEKYAKSMSWEGYPSTRDYYLIDVNSGDPKLIGEQMRGYARLSPDANFAYWFDAVDTAWYAHSTLNNKTIQLTNNEEVPYFDELNDRPMLPSSYGTAGWLEKDAAVLIYDRYDIWEVDPTGQKQPIRLTEGREQQLRYRFIQLDEEARAIDPDAPLLLYVFDEKTKGSGYATLNRTTKTVRKLVIDNEYLYDSSPLKAKYANVVITTKENFHTFPDLQLTNMQFRTMKTISDANPQQKDYSWGKSELYEWTSLDGQQLQGMLMTPEDFDPKKKYPMIVYYYERSSDRLNRYYVPRAGRSSINYSFYVSRGYVVFNPDVPYKVGYPGESAYDAVVSGTTALIDEGFIDKDRIGIQGHSWGGYQTAHIITKTNLFKCAESGAPVVNMTSAYGGIRWGSGLSRMFQYERTQSRIGGTLWEKPMRYLENSPLFFADKIETPVLILHNDEDTAVPWYQGIEFFVAMRRLGKPAWLLNYNGEPHGISKLQNRQDFQTRMQQFFDHYLMDQPMPLWMQRGVPPIEKGVKQGLECVYPILHKIVT